MKMCHFWAKNGLFRNFFGTNHHYYFHLLCNILRKFIQWIQSYEDKPFLGPKWSIYLKKKFWKKILLLWSTYWFLSLRTILKKFFQGIRSYKDVLFLGPKWPICLNENFSRKPVNKSSSFQSCLSTCQKSKSDTNLLTKYWWLKKTEISLAKSHFWK